MQHTIWEKMEEWKIILCKSAMVIHNINKMLWYDENIGVEYKTELSIILIKCYDVQICSLTAIREKTMTTPIMLLEQQQLCYWMVELCMTKFFVVENCIVYNIDNNIIVVYKTALSIILILCYGMMKILLCYKTAVCMCNYVIRTKTIMILDVRKHCIWHEIRWKNDKKKITYKNMFLNST